MHTTNRLKHTAAATLIASLTLAAGLAPALAGDSSIGTTFTYQGQLSYEGEPAETAVDLLFRLYDGPTGSNQIGPLLFFENVEITGGVFTIDLDFGDGVFTGESRWLEITVFEAGQEAGHTLDPRQPIMPAPYALYAADGNEGPEGPAGPTGPQGPQGEPGDSHWSINGSATYYNDGNVGIGTASPSRPLHVVGSSTDFNGTIAGWNIGSTGQGVGVQGGTNASSGSGVLGLANNTSGGSGVWGAASGFGTGVRGTASSNGYAARFTGGPSYFEMNVGIGTLEPQRNLHIQQGSTDASAVGLQIENTNGNDWSLYVAVSSNLGFRFNDTLMARINASDGAYVQLSDRRAKRSIEPLVGVLGHVLQLQPSSYFLNNDPDRSQRSFGLIAQDIAAIFPEVVTEQEGQWGVSYSKITVLNTAAIIELNDKLEDQLQAKREVIGEQDRAIAALADRNEALEARLAALEEAVAAMAR